MSLRRIYYSIPPNLRLAARRLYYYPWDVVRTATGVRHKYEPPRGLTFIGSGDFIEQGKNQLRLLIDHCKLKPDHRVLDIGSGIGRTAAALTTYLSAKGQYEGIDVMQVGVDWCKSRIGKDHPNFRFTLVDLENDLYRKSNNSAAEYVFPFANHTFDVIFLFSVFTHMLPDEVENYAGEIARMLKPEGRCLATFFVYTKDEEEHIAGLDTGFSFPHDKGTYRLMDDDVKSANVAYEKGFLEQIFANCQMQIDKYIEGTWRRGDGGSHFQDIYLLKPLTL